MQPHEQDVGTTTTMLKQDVNEQKYAAGDVLGVFDEAQSAVPHPMDTAYVISRGLFPQPVPIFIKASALHRLAAKQPLPVSQLCHRSWFVTEPTAAIFLSHRWETPKHPDPDQATFRWLCLKLAQILQEDAASNLGLEAFGCLKMARTPQVLDNTGLPFIGVVTW